MRFAVPGLPATAGSKVAFLSKRGRVVVREDCGRARSWRHDVQWAAREAHPGRMLVGPLRLSARFHLPRPKAHLGTRGVKASAPTRPIVRPDATKLLRALEDALTRVLYADDAQIVLQVVEKHYGEPGVVVELEELGG